MKILKLAGLLIIIICCTSFSESSLPGVQGARKTIEGSLHGYVVDAVTKKPLTGVTVSLLGSKTSSDLAMQSDAAGYFKFSKLPPGDVIVMVEKKGYKAYKSEVQSVKEGTIKINIEVQPGEDDEIEAWHPLGRFMDF